MRNKTKAAVTINRLGEKQGEGGGRRGIFWDHMDLRGERRGEGTRLPPPPPPRPFLQATNNEYSVIMTF